jgi:hypothetical protein
MVDRVSVLIEEARQAGASISMDGDRLRIAQSESLSEDLMTRLKERASEIIDYLNVEIVPRDRTHGEILDSVLYKAQNFHDLVLSRPPAWSNPQLLHIQSRSADATLATAGRLQAASLAAKQDPNRAPSPRLLSAAAEASEYCRRLEEQQAAKAARDAARIAAASPPDDATS